MPQLRSGEVSSALFEIQMSERLNTGDYTWVIGPKHGHIHVKRGKKIIFIPKCRFVKFDVRATNNRSDCGPWELCVSYLNGRGHCGQEPLDSYFETCEQAEARASSLNRYMKSIESSWDP